MAWARTFKTFVPPSDAFIIEVMTWDNLGWTAMATERAGIARELENAPRASAVTIHEWRLAVPINGHPAPDWQYIGSYPWRG